MLLRIILPLALLAPAAPEAASYAAYSLREAQARLEAGRDTREVSLLSGITHLTGMVVDDSSTDVILVGLRETNPLRTALGLDDLVVSMRALMVHQRWPLVSIDNTPQTRATRRQQVRFEGGIVNTRFGQQLLDADLLLKQLALGKRAAEIWGVKSYAALCDEAAQRGEVDPASVLFWFFPTNSRLIEREGVFVVRGYSVGTRTQVLSLPGASPTSNPAQDPSGDRFARDMTSAFAELAAQYPELRQIEQLYSAVALAHGLRETKGLPDLNFFLHRYKLPQASTPDEVPLVTAQGEKMTLNGGVELRALLLRLRDGDVTALREAVLRSRPGEHALSWPLPLSEWQIDDAAIDSTRESEPALDQKFGSLGVSINRAPVGIGPDAGRIQPALPSINFQNLPPLMRSPTFPPVIRSPSVGGVMLNNAATVVGGNGDGAPAASSFALLAEGEGSSLSAEAYRRFITALWAVYFTETDPGISIDPIAPGVKQHLVRYIGNVMNSDLGRVMREADYVMKQWAVGSARPEISGFQNPDDIAGRRGVAYVGAGSRFWFVPKGLTFRQTDGMLVFERGQMTVQTEFLFNNSQGLKADPANEQWAKWFTDHYGEVTAKHAVFADLFEYAKVVALAKHLKESGAPLLWFLLANKDLALTEDSPGTVEALVKNSEHFDGLRIEGGVQLVSPPQYILDETAQAALATARARGVATNTISAEKPSREQDLPPTSRRVAERNYSVVPQHALTSGKDRRGHRYQTDFALRSESGPGLELVRWFSAAEDDAGDFGRGWRLLIPYRIEPDGEDLVALLNAQILARMKLHHALSGRTEVLTFSTNRYSVAGWVPEDLRKSDVLGLFPMSGATFRLEDKVGNRFAFTAAGHLTEMAFARNYRMRIEYAGHAREVIDTGSWRIRAGREEVPFSNALVPRALTLVNTERGLRETYLFSTKRTVAGYEPAIANQRGRAFIAMLSDGSLRLEDAKGNELRFGANGNLDAVYVETDAPLLRAIVQGTQRVEFRYQFNLANRPYLSKATLRSGQTTTEIHYVQDEDGRLIRVHNGRANSLSQASGSTRR